MLILNAVVYTSGILTGRHVTKFGEKKSTDKYISLVLRQFGRKTGLTTFVG